MRYDNSKLLLFMVIKNKVVFAVVLLGEILNYEQFTQHC